MAVMGIAAPNRLASHSPNQPLQRTNKTPVNYQLPPSLCSRPLFQVSLLTNGNSASHPMHTWLAKTTEPVWPLIN